MRILHLGCLKTVKSCIVLFQSAKMAVLSHCCKSLHFIRGVVNFLHVFGFLLFFIVLANDCIAFRLFRSFRDQNHKHTCKLNVFHTIFISGRLCSRKILSKRYFASNPHNRTHSRTQPHIWKFSHVI